jgi:apolipoprotein N-acyltransferase
MAGGPGPALRACIGLALVAALGALQTLAYTATQFWWLQLLCIAVLAARLATALPRRAALLGLAYGTAWVGSATWWLFVSMHRYGGLPGWMAALAVLGLAAVLSLYLAFACAAFARWRTGRPRPDAVLFAALWLLAELARAEILTGFPWAATGYAHVDAPLGRLAPWVGVYGIGAVAAGLAAWSAFVAVRVAGPRRVAGLAGSVLCLVALAWLPVPDFTRPTGTLSVTLLQGNIPQDEKFEATHQATALEWHLQALVAARSDLVVAPETAIPFLPQQMPDGVWDALQARFSSGATAALVGVPLGDDQIGYTNSAAGFAPGQAMYRYDKQHLVPFGEFIPNGFHWFTERMNIPLGDFNRGPLTAPSFAVKGERIAPNICYEDLFGEELAVRFRDPTQAPTIFANLTNIGWFGDTVAIPQHLAIARLRTLELQRPMLRATNTGATVVIDHRGVVRHELPPHTRGVLEGRVEGREGLTPFARWAAAFGLWPLWALGALVAAAFAGLARRGRRTAAPQASL